MSQNTRVHLEPLEGKETCPELTAIAVQTSELWPMRAGQDLEARGLCPLGEVGKLSPGERKPVVQGSPVGPVIEDSCPASF